MTITDDHQRANHEAWHAAFALRAGDRVDYIDIDQSFSATGMGGIRCGLSYTVLFLGANEEAAWRAVEGALLTMIAGSVGDACLLGQTFAEAWARQTGDKGVVTELFNNAGVPPKPSRRRRLIDHAARRVRELAPTLQPFVDELVPCLLKRRRLEKEEIEAIWNRHRQLETESAPDGAT